MFEAFCKDKLAPLTLRLALGLVCVEHGFTKIMATGGLNWSPGMPLGGQLAVAWGEFGAGLAILLGVRCRLAALTVLVLYVGQLAWWHGWAVFRMPVRNLEPTAVLMMIGVALLCLGAGEVSLDARGSSSAAPASKGNKRKAAA